MKWLLKIIRQESGENMESFYYSLNATIPIFLVMIIGGLIRKWNIINDEFVNISNKYVFKVALPFLLFRDIKNADMLSNFDVKFVLYCAIVTTICFMGMWAVCRLVIKDKSIVGSFVQGSCRSSAAILGLAFIQNMYSDSGMAPLMIVSAVPLFNIYSVIILTFEGGASDAKGNIKKAFINVLKNPIIIGILLGIPFSLLRIEFHPIIEKTINNVAVTATPLALIAIGAGFEGRQALKKLKPTIIGSFIKLIGLAAAFLPIAIGMGFRNQELMAILIMLASPSTVTCYIMAKNMNNDGVLASSIIVLTTLLSSVTLTGWIFILRVFGYV